MRGQPVPCRFCGGPGGDGHLFWDCPFPPLVEIRENPEFHELMEMDKSSWPRCLLWHGWLPLLSGVNGDSPRADTAAQGAGHILEQVLVAYISRLLFFWGPPDGFDAADIALQNCGHPNVWTDGSLVLDKVSGVSSSGPGFCSHFAGHWWSSRRLGHLDDLGPTGGVVESCFGFCSVPDPLQTVQRAEFFFLEEEGGILALQASTAVHLGVDNLNVDRHVGRLLDGWGSSCPAELLNDGDLILLIDRVLEQGARDTVRVTKVKGHGDVEMVRVGQVRELDKLGHDAADEAADFGRRRVDPAVIDATGKLCGVCRRWYPITLDLHRFFIAISRAVVSHVDCDGTAPDPLVWSGGALPNSRRLIHAVRNHAMLPGSAVIWTLDWVGLPPVFIVADGVGAWPYSVGLVN